MHVILMDILTSHAVVDDLYLDHVDNAVAKANKKISKAIDKGDYDAVVKAVNEGRREDHRRRRILTDPTCHNRVHEEFDNHMDPSVVDECLNQIAARFAGATVHSFIPLLVRRYVCEELQTRPAGMMSTGGHDLKLGTSPQPVSTSARTTPKACKALRGNHARNHQNSRQPAHPDGSSNP